MMARTKTRGKKTESLHHLISSLTYRASIGRTLLFTIILAPFLVYTVASLLRLQSIGEAASESFFPLLLIISAFFVYDFIYVTVANNAPIKTILDKCMLFAVELGALVVILLPLMWLEISAGFKNMYVAVLITATPTFILLVRILLGVRARQMKKRGR